MRPSCNRSMPLAARQALALCRSTLGTRRKSKTQCLRSPREGVQAVQVTSDAYFFVHRQKLAALSLKYRLASMFPQREYTEAGGLMSYGEALGDFYRRTAIFVHKLMRGAKPAE